VGFEYDRSLRLRSRAELRRVFDNGRLASDARCRVWVVPNDLGRTRFAVSVGRRHGNAVRRNRLKRVVREAFRLVRNDLPAGIDVVCSPRYDVDVQLETFRESLRSLIRAALGRRRSRDMQRASDE
jgi:ribonuclease P protein component